MTQITRETLAISGVLLLGGASPAWAQAPELYRLEEIVVTAEKREASLQQTPLAIRALSGQDLENAGVQSTLDLQLVAPGVVISTNTAAAQIYIRGVGTNFGGDQSVAVHVDGVFQVTTQTALQEFLDVERVEILKGPQGTLYGRNATAGVVNIISKKPVMDWEFEGDLQYGNYDKFRQRAMVNAPIIEDRLAARVSFVNTDRDGYRRNPFLDTRIDDENLWALRGQLLFTPTEDLEIVLAGNYSEEDSSRTLGFKINPNVFAPQVDLLPTLGIPGGTVPDDPGIIFSDKDSIQSFDQYGGSLNASLDLGPVVFKSLTAYQENDLSQDIDVDGTEIPYFDSHLDGSKTKWFSQELQLASNNQAALEWIAGLYYLADNRKTRGTFTTPLFEEIGLADGPIHRDFDQKTKAYAAFGQATYNVTDSFRVTAGARFSRERKEAIQYNGNRADLGVDITRKETWNAFTPKLALDYSLAEDVMIYASVTRGFKSGGFNESARDLFDPEYIWSYEAGLRSTLWDGRLRFNATAFYYDYSDIQVNQALAEPDPDTGATTGVSNAASAEVKGLEFEVSVLPFANLQIGANASILDAKYKTYLAPNTELDGSPIVDLSGNRLPRAPKFAAALTARYSQPVAQFGTAFIQGDLYYQSRIYFSAFNAVNDQFDQEKAYEVLNARAGFEAADGHWSISVYGQNLANKTYRQNIIRGIGFFGQLDLLAPPRTYGVQLGVKF